jgi:Inhibitor of growth proteins N-terminal histone-binding
MSSSAVTTAAAPQVQGVRHSVRQTRTNPSRTSKTAGRASFFYGQSSTADVLLTPVVPHGLYPALTHFTDAITALPREFRRHNSLLKEVDAKAWALEENLQQLLKMASDSEPSPVPPNPTPIVDGVIRGFAGPKVSCIEPIKFAARVSLTAGWSRLGLLRQTQDTLQTIESQESKNRRLLFDRIRHTVSDLMLTADEKNHVIASANDELDHQLFRLGSIFPHIASEISEEARLGSLTHWAYSNKGTAKAVAVNERPRREAAAAHHQHLAHGLHEAEAASRSEARREAVLARKQRRHHADSDFDETRGGAAARKGPASKVRASTNGDLAVPDSTAQGIASTAGTASVPQKRRKLEKPLPPVQAGAPMERSLSAANNSAGRATSKEASAADPKKRIRAPSALATAGRKRYDPMIRLAEGC